MLQLAVLVPLAVFVLFSLRHEVKLDWTGAPWLAALPLIAGGLADAPARGSVVGCARLGHPRWPCCCCSTARASIIW